MDFIRPKRASARLDLTPLIDVVFQLLVFFMLTSSFAHPAMKLMLPTASARETIDPQQLVVSVDRDGKVFVNTDLVEIDALKRVLEQKLAGMEKKQVNFRGDEQMHYQRFVQVMDIAKQAGAKQLNIVHQEAR
jgi:biopolymer transport protein ExbD